MNDKINEILSEVKSRIEQAGSESELQNVKSAFVGKPCLFESGRTP